MTGSCPGALGSQSDSKDLNTAMFYKVLHASGETTLTFALSPLLAVHRRTTTSGEPNI